MYDHNQHRAKILPDPKQNKKFTQADNSQTQLGDMTFFFLAQRLLSSSEQANGFSVLLHFRCELTHHCQNQ
jgi:hypothetical protein